MKALQGRWRQICKLNDAIFGRIEQSVPTAGRGCASKAGNSVPEYAKLNLPKGRWQDRAQSDSWKTTSSSSSQDWVEACPYRLMMTKGIHETMTIKELWAINHLCKLLPGPL